MISLISSIILRAYLATGERAVLEVPRKEYLARFAAPDEPQDHPQALIDMLHQTGVRARFPACAGDPLQVMPAVSFGITSNSFGAFGIFSAIHQRYEGSRQRALVQGQCLEAYRAGRSSSG